MLGQSGTGLLAQGRTPCLPGTSPVASREVRFGSSEPNTVAGPRRNLTGFRDVPIRTLDRSVVVDNPGAGPGLRNGPGRFP